MSESRNVIRRMLNEASDVEIRKTPEDVPLEYFPKSLRYQGMGNPPVIGAYDGDEMLGAVYAGECSCVEEAI